MWRVCQSSVLVPLTPLTGRRYLREKEGLVTPVSTATQSVSRLQFLLSSSKTYPTDVLLEFFRWVEKIVLELLWRLVHSVSLSVPFIPFQSMVNSQLIAAVFYLMDWLMSIFTFSIDGHYWLHSQKTLMTQSSVCVCEAWPLSCLEVI